MNEVFKNREEIEAWLKTQPRDVIAVFAVRIALRTIPQFWFAMSAMPIEKRSGAALMPALWSSSASYSTVMWPNKTIDPKEAIPEKPLMVANPSFIIAAYAADMSSSESNDIEAAVATAHSAEIAAEAVYYSSGEVISTEYIWDKNFISKGHSPQELLHQALWTIIPKNILNQWHDLKRYLLSLDQDWDIWTEWYEDRLRGNQSQPFTLPFVPEIEIGIDPENGQCGRVTFPPEDYEDPAKVNAAIKRLIADYRARQALLEQDSKFETFGINEDGKITRTTAKTSTELTETLGQRNWYKALRQAALGMKDIGENALGRAARPVNNVLNALPEDLTDAKVALLWPAANRIRKLKAAHDRAIASGDDYHPNRLADEVVDDIDQFNEVYNNFVVGDAGLSAKDKEARGPQEPEIDAVTSVAVNQGIEANIENGLFKEEAEAVIDIDISNIEKHSLDIIRRERENATQAFLSRIRDEKKLSVLYQSTLTLSVLPFAIAIVLAVLGVI